MLLKLAVACTVVVLSVSPCLGQSLENPVVDSNRYSLSGTLRRAWQTDARGLMELAFAKHPQGANRCLDRKVDVNDRIGCFQRLIKRHFLRQVSVDSTQMRSWCLDDANPGLCLESMAAQELELWLYKRKIGAPLPAQAEFDPLVRR